VIGARTDANTIAVGLNEKPRFQAGEVDDIRSDEVLTCGLVDTCAIHDVYA